MDCVSTGWHQLTVVLVFATVGVEESVGETKEGRLAADGVWEWLEREGRGEERALAVAAALAQEMREAVWKETGCTCSAGIAHNKVSMANSFTSCNNGQSWFLFPSVDAG